MGYRMGRQEESIKFGRVLRIFLIIIGVLIICAAVFFSFYIRVNAKQCLRDAKNVHMALNSIEIEYYAQGKSIYDPTRYSGLAPGVQDAVSNLVENEGRYRLLGYDDQNHRITVLQYRNGFYEVNYYASPTEEVWEVNYLMNIYHLGD